MLSPPAVASLQTFPKPFSFLYDSVNLSCSDLSRWAWCRQDGQAGAQFGSAGLGLAVLGPGAGREGRAGKGSAWQGRNKAEAGQSQSDERLVRDVDHVAVVENASFESGCDFDTEVVQGVMWH
ncbi:hypothetical protein PPACK8108_LOCUS4543 [Phakopsora pachyrhizi]|uniref:Uncharacterized protein n=1 Tax=Phakopsora pachyrhizi TaxID=170000 RepID=A0AAV0AME7_PHAPC|nr:hypothetical protein PPACK8108_LOCUS4543 [Phakopsora pachyrhizi]